MTMQPYPHHYRASASGGVACKVDVASPGLTGIDTWAPPEFDGPEGQWSPETLLVASVADCFVLTFRAVARASRLVWERIEVDVHATLDRVDGAARFTTFLISPRVTLADAADADRLRAVLEKAKKACLVTNSLKADCVLAPPEALVTPAGVPA
jgi:organic hydroperoxide reductase OsmC/OhrA